MNTNKINKIIFTFTAFLSTYLCIKTIELGLIKYEKIRSKTGGDFPIFSDLKTQYIIGISYVLLNVIYLFWLKINLPDKQQKSNLFLTIKPGLLYVIIAFLSYPIGNDIYLYLQYGVMALNGVNPFVEGSGPFASNLSPFLRWGQTSSYGPISIISFILAALPVSISPIIGIYIFKLFCVILHFFNTYLLWETINFSDWRSKITLAYFIHPLLLYEQISVAHVDIYISTCVLVIAYLFQKQRYPLTIVISFLGFLAKTIPILWMPMIGVFLLGKRQFNKLIIPLITVSSIMIILKLTVLPTMGAWKSLLNPGVTNKAINSLHALYAFLLENHLDISSDRWITLFRLITLSAWGIYYFFTLWRIFQNKYSQENLILDIGWVTLSLFLFATPWFTPWYPAPLLAIAAIKFNAKQFTITVLLLSLSSSFSYLTSAPINSMVVLIPIAFLIFSFLRPHKDSTN